MLLKDFYRKISQSKAKLTFFIISFAFCFTFAPPDSYSQVAFKRYTGAAPIEHNHKVKKKIDTSGNIHRGPGDVDFENTRGPNVLAGCASKGMTYTDEGLCNTLAP